MYLTKYNKVSLVNLLLRKLIYSNSFIVNLISLGKNGIGLSREAFVQLLNDSYSKINVDATDGKLNTPLILACLKGHYQIAKVLISYKANVNKDNVKENRPLFFACFSNNVQIAKLLLDTNKIEINHKNNDGDTELSIACINDNPELIHLLMDHQADINTINQKGYSPIHVATINNKLETLKALHERGADFNSDNSIGNQCFSLASINGYREIMDYLVSLNVDYNHTNNSGDSALHQCCILQKVDMVKYILNLDRVVIDVPNSYGFTPFLIACKKNSLELVKIFLEHKDANTINFNVKSNGGDFPLFYATHYKNVELIRILLDRHADVYNERDAERFSCFTPFLMACSYFGNVEIIQIFLDHGVDVNRPNSFGFYPIAVACKSERIEQVRILLEHGANPNVRSKTATPLVQSCIDGTLEIAKELIQHGADVNYLTNEGLHPLFFLINETHKHNKEYIQYLIDQGSDLYCKDNYGNSLLYVLKNSNKVDKEEAYHTLITAYKARNDYREHCPDTTAFIHTYDTYIQVMAKIRSQIALELNPIFSNNNINGSNNNNDNEVNNGITKNIINRNNSNGDNDILTTSSSTTINANNDDGSNTTLNNKAIDSNKVETNYSVPETLAFSAEELNRAFLQACIFGKMNEVELLLLRHPTINVNVRETNGDTPLIISCQTGKADIAQLLLQYNADPNLICECGNTALYVATFSFSRHRSLGLIRSLLDHGANPNILSQYCLTPLMVACKDQLDAVAELLLQYNADPNLQDMDGNSALIMACNRGGLNMVNILLASKNININTSTKDGYTPLMIACNKRYLDITKMLIEAQSKFSLKNYYGQTAFHLCCNYYINDVFNRLHDYTEKVDLLDEDVQGFSPYLLLKLNGTSQLFTLLMDYEINYLQNLIQCYQHFVTFAEVDLPEDADLYLGKDQYHYLNSICIPLNLRKNDSTSPFHEIQEKLEHLQHQLHYIQEEKEEFEWFTQIRKEYQENPLSFCWSKLSKKELSVFFIYANIYLDVKLIYHIVTYNEDEDEDESITLKWLLNSQDQDGNSALHYICSNERHTRDVINTLAKFLLSFPELDKNIQNHKGYTPLMLACYRCNETVAKLLMNHPQVDLLALSKYHQNALMLACQCRSIVIVRRLVELQVDMDVQDHIYGDTALTIITKYYQSFNILPLLVNKGHANVNIANWMGETPLLLACQANNIENIQILVDHGAKINFFTPNSSVSPSSTNGLLESPFERGQTPLIAAIRNFNYYAMDYLLRHHADPNFTDDEGESPLMATCRAYNKYGSELLLQNQADPDYRNEQGESPRSIIKLNQFNFILGI
ncbi:ankyrin repeat-containing domain protein [Neocallimastix sp. 'constans']